MISMQALIYLESIVMSNKWGAHNKIDKLDEGYSHQVVNYSKNFVNLMIGAFAK